jgi:hypothetical protein
LKKRLLDKLHTEKMVAPVFPDAALLMKVSNCVEDVAEK